MTMITLVNCIFYLVCLHVIAFVAALLWKLYLKLRIKPQKSYTCLIGKTAIITGANTGIGFVTALDLAQRGAKVILACRNENKAKEAVERVINETKNPNVTYKILDLKSFKSVRDFAKDIDENEDKIDILINNAGVGGIGNRITEDGNQIALQVNYLSHFLLTHLLMDKLRKSSPSRIINVSSIVAKFAKINPRNLNEYPKDFQDNLGRFRMYANSKLCQIYFTLVLAEKLKSTGITVNVLHPGSVRTEIFRRLPYEKLIDLIARLYFKTPEEGSRTTIYLATSRLVEKITGKLYDNCTQIELYNAAKDPILGEKIWSKSEELVSLQEHEKIF